MMSHDFDAAVKVLAIECLAIQNDEFLGQEPKVKMEAVVRHVLSAGAQDRDLFVGAGR